MYMVFLFSNFSIGIITVLSLAGRRWQGLSGGGASGSGAGSDGLHGHGDLCEDSKQLFRL